jgi:hypothetical protein
LKDDCVSGETLENRVNLRDDSFVIAGVVSFHGREVARPRLFITLWRSHAVSLMVVR